MIDIVVTIPKSRQKAIEAEEVDVARRIAAGEKGITYYWEMGRMPRCKPDRLYFVWDGAIRAWHDVLDMWSPIRHLSSSRAGRLILDPVIHMLSVPIPSLSFRGFRYLEKRLG